MSITIVLGIIIIHYLADFVLQSDKMAVNKSKSNFYLGQHVFIYTIMWLAVLFPFEEFKYYPYITFPQMTLLFCLITFVCHFITDYITSRISSYFYKREERHNFFLIIGIDQVFHYIQLFITFKLIYGNSI